MSLSENVRTGAAYTRRKSATNPLEVMGSLLERYQQEEFEFIFAKWSERIQKNNSLLEATLRYAARNYWKSFVAPRKRKTPEQLQQRAVEQARVEQIVCNVASDLRRMILLDMLMPNGQKLRNCTLDYVWSIGGKFSQIGKKGDERMIDEVYSEKDMQDKLAK